MQYIAMSLTCLATARLQEFRSFDFFRHKPTEIVLEAAILKGVCLNHYEYLGAAVQRLSKCAQRSQSDHGFHIEGST